MSTDDRGRFLSGKYELVRPVGRGGMASVWLGLTHGEAGFTRPVAIKRVLRHLTEDEKFAAMFVEEARVVADLQHPNIVQIHDFGRDQAGGGYYIVMEWVEGLSLENFVRSYARVHERTPWPLCCAIAIEVLRALSAAHERVDLFGSPAPVIHRDVTPANILIGENGCVKLADFGLSRATDRPNMTDPGIVKGKVAYLAPESLQGAGPSPANDLYTMGVVLWEALAAERLFGGRGGATDVEIAQRILEGQVPPLSAKRSDIPIALSELVAQAIDRDPRRRFTRAAAMVEALSSILRNQSTPTDGAALSQAVREAIARLPRGTAHSVTPPPPPPRTDD